MIIRESEGEIEKYTKGKRDCRKNYKNKEEEKERERDDNKRV